MTGTLVGGPSGKRWPGTCPGDSEGLMGKVKSLAEIRAPITVEAQRGPVTCPPHSAAELQD